MNTRKNSVMSTNTLVMYALLTAIVVVLQIVAESFKVGPCALSFVLVPIVVGAALCGWKCGGWLGFVFAVVVLLCPSTQLFYAINIVGTVSTVIVKGVAAGLVAGLVYKLLEKTSKLTAVITAAVVCPVVNTGIFLGGCYIFFLKEVKEWIFGVVLFNFLFEFVTNLILIPVIVRLISIRQKKF